MFVKCSSGGAALTLRRLEGNNDLRLDSCLRFSPAQENWANTPEKQTNSNQRNFGLSNTRNDGSAQLASVFLVSKNSYLLLVRSLAALITASSFAS